MSSNLTKTIPEDQLPGLVPRFFMYFVIGMASLIPNVVTIMAIWRHEILRIRKEYILISCLSLADSLQGLAYSMAGLTRINMIWEGTANDLQTRLDCFLKPWNLIWLPFKDTNAATLLMISLDRLLSMLFPLRYIAWGRQYAFWMILVHHIPYMPLVVYEIVKLIPDDRKFIANVCYTSYIMVDDWMIKFLLDQRAALAWGSVFLYLAVVFKYRQQVTNVLPHLNEQGQKVRIEGQRRLTITLGLSCMCTLLFYILPTYLFRLLPYVTGDTFMSSMAVATISPLKAINYACNPILYLTRHRDIRLGVKCLFTCTELTQNVINPPIRVMGTGDEGRKRTSVKPTGTSASPR